MQKRRSVRALAAIALIAAAAGSSLRPVSPSLAGTEGGSLPAPPASGEMGFAVHHFVPAVLQGQDACPDGINVRSRELFYASLPADESARLRLPEHQAEFMRRYLAVVSRPDGANLCSNYDRFPDRPPVRTVQSKYSHGMNLDGDTGPGGRDPDTCAHENFVSPHGEPGIDNQAYRAMGCKGEWRGVDGLAGDIVRGYNGFLISGEWSQVLLLRGVDSLADDDRVEVIYANTQDRAVTDSQGKFLANASYTITDKGARARNVLRGRIAGGVLTTEPALIRLSQTWGQGAPRDIRGARTRWTLHKGRLRLTFRPDGSLSGMLGGYEPIDEFVQSIGLGGLSNLISGGADCAGEYNTLKQLADGMRDPKTGKCTAVSTAIELMAVPAFVNDISG